MKTPGKLFEKSVLRGLKPFQADNSESAVQERREALSDLVDNMMTEKGISPLDGNNLPPAQNDAEKKILKIFGQMSAPAKGTGVLYSPKEMKINQKKMAQLQGELFYILDTQQISQPYIHFCSSVFTSLMTSYDLAADRNHLMTTMLDNFSFQQQSAYFSLLHKSGYSDEFELEVASKDIPLKIRNLYKKWRERNAGRLDEIKDSLINQLIDDQLEALKKEVAVEDVLAGAMNPNIPPEITKQALEDAISVASEKYDLYIRMVTGLGPTIRRDTSETLWELVVGAPPAQGTESEKKFTKIVNSLNDEFKFGDQTWEDVWPDLKNKNRFTALYGQLFVMMDKEELSLNQRLEIFLWFNDFMINFDEGTVDYRRAQVDFFDHLSFVQQNSFFSLIHKFDGEKSFQGYIDDQTIPLKIRNLYKKWTKHNADNIEHIQKFDFAGELEKEIADLKAAFEKHFGQVPAEPEKIAESSEETLAITEPESLPVETFSTLTIIELEHPVVLEGESDGMLAVIQGEDALKGPLSHVKHDKRSLMLNLLEKSGIPMSACTLYKQKGVQGRDTDRYPYEVLEINHDRLHALALICNWTNFATFVIRDPKHFDGSEPIVLSDVRDMDNAWRIVHRSPAQWDQETYKTLFTSIKLLPVQLKHIIAWGDQRDNLIDSFGATIAATGRIPTSTDDSIIAYGPLAGKTTWSRAYRAVNKGSIFGLEDVKNFHQLYDHASLHDSRLSNFMGRKPLPDARAVFTESVRFSRENGFPPQKLLFGDLRCFDRPAQHISDGFALGAIKGWEHLVEDPTLKPASLDEFIAATGLGEWRGNTLELAGDVEELNRKIHERFRKRSSSGEQRNLDMAG